MNSCMKTSDPKLQRFISYISSQIDSTDHALALVYSSAVSKQVDHAAAIVTDQYDKLLCYKNNHRQFVTVKPISLVQLCN